MRNRTTGESLLIKLSLKAFRSLSHFHTLPDRTPTLSLQRFSFTIFASCTKQAIQCNVRTYSSLSQIKHCDFQFRASAWFIHRLCSIQTMKRNVQQIVTECDTNGVWTRDSVCGDLNALQDKNSWMSAKEKVLIERKSADWKKKYWFSGQFIDPHCVYSVHPLSMTDALVLILI